MDCENSGEGRTLGHADRQYPPLQSNGRPTIHPVLPILPSSPNTTRLTILKRLAILNDCRESRVPSRCDAETHGLDEQIQLTCGRLRPVPRRWTHSQAIIGSELPRCSLDPTKVVSCQCTRRGWSRTLRLEERRRRIVSTGSAGWMVPTMAICCALRSVAVDAIRPYQQQRGWYHPDAVQHRPNTVHWTTWGLYHYLRSD